MSTIICLDSEGFLYSQISKSLHQTSFSVRWCDRLELAIQATRQLKEVLIISAENIKLLSVFETYRKLKHALPHTPFVFFVVLRNPGVEAIKEGLSLGIDNFIFNPMDAKEISDKYRYAIEKRMNGAPERLFDFDYWFASFQCPVALLYQDKIVRFNRNFKKLLCKLQGENFAPLVGRLGADEDWLRFDEIAPKLQQKAEIRSVTFSKVGTNGDQLGLVCHAFLEEPKYVKMLEKGCDIDQQPRPDFDFHLTNREREILKISAQGKSLKEIAIILEISQRTVEKHRSNILQKTGTGNILEAIHKLRIINF